MFGHRAVTELKRVEGKRGVVPLSNDTAPQLPLCRDYNRTVMLVHSRTQSKRLRLLDEYRIRRHG